MTTLHRTENLPDHVAHRSGKFSPREHDDLWVMEEHFWTSGADSARTTSAANAVIVFPYPPGILQGDLMWDHLKKRTGWRSVVMTEGRVSGGGEFATLTYRASAEKPDVPIYEALCASTYLNDGGNWLRLSHQQTAVM